MHRSRTFALSLSAILCLTGSATAQDPDWDTMPYTTHSAYQAVDATGNGTFPTTSEIKMKGIILNRPSDMLNPAPGADPFMGGQWQQFIQPVAGEDFGGTAMWMGQNIGKTPGHVHPADSYTDAEWLAEVDRINHDPGAGRAFRVGDLVEIRARAPGLFRIGKTNINEQHSKVVEANFDVVLVQANYGQPTPQVVTLADLKDASDQFIFDQTRATGNERHQGTVIQINNVTFTSTANWAPAGQLTIQDGTGRTFPVLLGLGEGFTRFDPPFGSFNIVGILDQEDANAADGFKAGYRLWIMDYTGSEFVLYRYVKPDFDQNGDVNGDDLTHFEACATGPSVPQENADCLNADFDADNDVDQEDFAVLQRCLAGMEYRPDPACDR
jgi:hypothetical protein